VTYRVQSLFAVHAGLATIGAYIRYGETSWSVEPNPDAPFPCIGLTSALHTLHLARYVFDRFGIADGQLEVVWEGLIATCGQPPAN
jgi:hypothetical protein